MRVHAENLVRNQSNKVKGWLAEELVRNLREMFDRIDSGDTSGIAEFRELFCFESKHPAESGKEE